MKLTQRKANKAALEMAMCMCRDSDLIKLFGDDVVAETGEDILDKAQKNAGQRIQNLLVKGASS